MSHWIMVAARRGWKDGSDITLFLLEAELEDYEKMLPNKFVSDMIAAGYRVEPYAGRRYWTGPAVRAYDGQTGLQAVIRATSVPLTWDTLGMGYIVYPVEADPIWYDNATGYSDLDSDLDGEDFDIGGEA